MLIFTINQKSLETIYFAYIRSLSEYADVLWDNCTQQQCNEIEKIQLEAGRIVTGATKLVKIDKLYKELGWLKLSERKDLHKLFLFFKMNHGLSPLYLSNILPLHVAELSSYRLGNAENYVGIHANTRAYAESFLPSTLQAWKNLPEAVPSFRARKLYTSARIYEWKFGKGEWKLPFASPTGRVDFFGFVIIFEEKKN